MAAKQVCCVKDCPGTDADVTYFNIPEDEDRRLQWLKLIQRTDLYNKQGPTAYAVCSVHFEKSKINVLKQPLPNAIPTKNVPRKNKDKYVFTSNTASQTDFSSSEEDDDDEVCGEKVVIYKRITPNRKMFVCWALRCNTEDMNDDEVDEKPTFSLNYSVNEPRDSIDLGNRKIFAFCDDEDDKVNVNNSPNSNKDNNIDPIITEVVSLNDPINIFKKFFEWRHRIYDKRKGSKYDKQFKIFSLNLHTINTRAYRLLMDSWKLPKENELKDVPLKIEPRFDERVVRLLGQKFKSLSGKGKFCTLGLYAMPLKPHFYYDSANDDIIGVHNVNGNKKRTAATYALIAMVRGLLVPWHQPVAYSFFSTMNDVDNIEVFLKNIIRKLKDMGLNILGVVMGVDQFFWKYCRSKHFISPTKPFLHIGTDKLYVVFDIPHVINMFKDEFLENDYVVDEEYVSGKYVKQVYHVDQEQGCKLSKLNDEHIKVGRKGVYPERSSQVFSKAVCGALYFYKEIGLIDTKSTRTANFIKKLNDIFDVLINVNKDTSYDSRMKMAAAQSKAYENGFSLFKKLAKVINAKTNTITDADSIIYFLVSFKSLMIMSCALKDAHLIGITQARLCHLEPTIELIKSIKKDVKSNKPSAIKFTGSFSKLFLKNLIDLTSPPTSIDNMDDFLKMADGVKDFYKTYDGDRIRLKDNDYRFKLPEIYAIIYVSSYLLYKCSKVHTCKEFTEFLTRTVDLNKTKVYIHFENYNKEADFYNKLKLPPFELPTYVEKLDNHFLTSFNEFFHLNPAETIFRALKNVPKWNLPCACFPNEYMLKLFVRTRMYETILHNSNCLKNLSVDTPYTLKAKQL